MNLSANKIVEILNRVKVGVLENVQVLTFNDFNTAIWEILKSEIPDLKEQFDALNKIGFTNQETQEKNYETALIKGRAEKFFYMCYVALQKNTDEGYKEFAEKIQQEFA
jgi:hypothetical protein